MLVQVRPCPRLALDGPTERTEGLNAARENPPSVEPGAEESDYRGVGELLELQPGATRECATTGRSTAIKGRGGALVDVQRDKLEGFLGTVPRDRTKAPVKVVREVPARALGI